MNTLFRFLLILSLPLITSASLQGQWARVGAPGGGNVARLAASGSRLFAVTEGTVYSSANAGGSWSAANNGLDSGVALLAASGTRLFAVVTNTEHYLSTVHRSTDFGATWKAASAGLPRTGISAVFALDSVLLVNFGADSGLFRSSDWGETWREIDSGWVATTASYERVHPYVSAFTVHDTTLYAATRYGLYSSTDKGISWMQSYRDDWEDVSMSGCIVVSDSAILVGDYTHLLRFVRSGNLISPAATSRAAFLVSSLLASGGDMFVGAINGLWRTSDGGGTWVHADSGLSCPSVNTLTASGAELYAGTRNGIFRSSDQGRSWTVVNPGLRMIEAVTLMCADSTLYAATWSYGSGVFRSTDSGASWHWIWSRGGQTKSVESIAVLGGTLFAGAERQGIFRSTDTGQSWDSVGAVGLRVFAANSTVLAVTDSDIVRSTDNGTSWERATSGITNINIDCFASHDTVLFLGASTFYTGGQWISGTVFRSTNKGQSWKRASAGLPPYTEIRELSLSGHALYAATDSGVYRSTDDGESWKATAGGIPFRHIYGLASWGPNVFAAGLGDPPYPNGIYASTNGGLSWRDIGPGWSSGSIVGKLVVAGGNLFAANVGGIWRRPLAEVAASVANGASAVPEAFTLYQNYPNPFNPVTTIRYSLPHRAHVSMSVFNTLGQVVATLVNGEVDAGIHQVQFNANTLASGMYFYRLQAEGHVLTRSLALVR